jgi:hypothetical protein
MKKKAVAVMMKCECGTPTGEVKGSVVRWLTRHLAKCPVRQGSPQ